MRRTENERNQRGSPDRFTPFHPVRQPRRTRDPKQCQDRRWNQPWNEIRSGVKLGFGRVPWQSRVGVADVQLVARSLTCKYGDGRETSASGEDRFVSERPINSRSRKFREHDASSNSISRQPDAALSARSMIRRQIESYFNESRRIEISRSRNKERGPVYVGLNHSRGCLRDHPRYSCASRPDATKSN